MVKWKWGKGWAEGEIVERYTTKTTVKIKGNEITRNATEDEPAYKIKQEDGSEALKSHSEVQKA